MKPYAAAQNLISARQKPDAAAERACVKKKSLKRSQLNAKIQCHVAYVTEEKRKPERSSPSRTRPPG